MEKGYFSPKEVVENSITESVKKVSLPFYKVVLFGILAGIFIAIGAQASNVAIHAVSNPGIAKTIAGVIFPVGLMFILIIGGQLFTGCSLIFMGVLDRKISISKLLTNWVTVFFSNYIGAACIGLLVFFSNQFYMNSGKLGAYAIYITNSKLNITATQAICSGIMCNIIVCAAILMAGASKDIAGKGITIFFAIFAFVVSGFEHCVANMYYLTAGFLASHNETFVQQAIDNYHITQSQIDAISMKNILVHNLLPVTIGNVIGGALIIGGLFYILYRNKEA